MAKHVDRDGDGIADHSDEELGEYEVCDERDRDSAGYLREGFPREESR